MRPASPHAAPHPARSLAAWLLLVGAAAAIGAVGSSSAPVFYSQLQLPGWAPPAGWFGPVWTVLYAMMAVAAWLVWRSPGRHGGALALFGFQLVANVLWSWFFFAWRSGEGAIADILVLDLLVVAALAAFWRIRPTAGALLLPYLAWILFATALSVTVWRMNPALL
ncbi:tryptophan-rich sensory protein [Caenimonas sedimenti]|uniref:Tryptophan-rich sensory protein n=1 Tax=Caenimonas sedimenti TaxID=2596921 RepID=A0A562ZLG2_9BURK|nr:TspO/MBR family protein [Caenimonas sedimenti]TWO69148.1 tryptophan-rich sensory protein [Caenimonas sedimenti]